jgi:hypothetical protein
MMMMYLREKPELAPDPACRFPLDAGMALRDGASRKVRERNPRRPGWRSSKALPHRLTDCGPIEFSAGFTGGAKPCCIAG